MKEFLIRYKELAIQGAYKTISLPYEGYLIYLEYWKKALGRCVKHYGRHLFMYFQKQDKDKRYKELWEPLWIWFKYEFIDSLDKTAGFKCFVYFILPILLLQILLYKTLTCLVYKC